MKNDQKIVPNLWFDGKAKEAVEFYISVFENSKINTTTRYLEAGQEFHQQEPGSVMTMDFTVEGFRMVALNGGPYFQLNPSISFFVFCKSENEAENLWHKLIAGGKELMPLESYDWSPKYGWLEDEFGVNWQLMLDSEYTGKQKIVPSLFFTGSSRGKAEEAVNYYTSVFKNTSVEGILKYGSENSYAEGTVMHSQFQLENQVFMAMDSGVENDFPFNEAISLVVNCKDQEEIDYYWNKLTEGGDPAAQQCGWLKDKFGISWQIVPEGMEELLNNPDKEKANRGMAAVFQMKKFDLAMLKKAIDDKMPSS
ncbi:VOC family protein [Autumnicola musiva]|uniref:VOC family protein n=1 Tax=Autumnicola musiva TaxID=3075589 RepID=A0ABU3D6W7_9FLAO|nr:VOC family protein [Zunongwangia sp. F117]MDT0677275.1 VOC family protein [Zunongwangia sp. F117]